MSKSEKAYFDLVKRGCLCGTDDAFHCKLHGPGDNRGIAAFFRAGMPGAFPMDATCAICRSEGLLYPNVELDDRDGSAEFRPTLVCPRCSKPAAEIALRREASDRHKLNSRTVFGTAAAA